MKHFNRMQSALHLLLLASLLSAVNLAGAQLPITRRQFQDILARRCERRGADRFCRIAEHYRSRTADHAPREREHTSQWQTIVARAPVASGCARNTAQREVSPAVHEGKTPPVRTAVRTRRYSEPYRYAAPRIRRPDLALLSPQPAPDCEFNRSDLRTVDPVEWARLKTEYERQCYQDAERAARDRLALLQTSSTCEIEPVRQRSSVRRPSAQPR